MMISLHSLTTRNLSHPSADTKPTIQRQACPVHISTLPPEQDTGENVGLCPHVMTGTVMLSQCSLHAGHPLPTGYEPGSLSLHFCFNRFNKYPSSLNLLLFLRSGFPLPGSHLSRFFSLVSGYDNYHPFMPTLSFLANIPMPGGCILGFAWRKVP